MEIKISKKTQKKIGKKFNEIISWLYEGRSLFDWINTFFFWILIFLFKLLIVGYRNKLYEGFFETFTLIMLSFLIILTIKIKEEGCVGFVNMFFAIGGFFWIIFDIYFFMTVAFSFFSWGVCVNILYIIIIAITKQNKNKK